MNKILAMTLAFVLCIGLAGCGGDSSTPKETTASATATAETTAVTTTITTAYTTASAETVSAADVTEGVKTAETKAPEGVREYHIVGFGHILNNYSIDLVEGDSYDNYYNLKVKDPELAQALGGFSSFFTIKTDASGGTLDEYELVDQEGNSLGQLSAKEIIEKYDPAARYEVTEWSYDGEVDLSELEEGKMYEAPVKNESISFVNDTDTDYLVWVSDTYEYRETPYAYPAREIGELGRHQQEIFIYDNVRVRIEKLTADMLSPDSFEPAAAFVNDVPKGESVDIGLADLLVNAGSESVSVDITDSSEKVTEFTLEAGDIYAIDFSNIRSVVVK